MSKDNFWNPATEPSPKELEGVLFLSFLRNKFCTQHTGAVQEIIRIQRKRQRLDESRKETSLHEINNNKKEEELKLEEEEEEEISSSAILNIITSLVRLSGMSNKSSVPEPPTTIPPITSSPPLTTIKSCELQEINEVTQELEIVTPEKAHQPRSALSVLIENARKLEQIQKEKSIKNNDNSSSINLEKPVAMTMHNLQSNKKNSNLFHESGECGISNDIDEDEFGVSLPFSFSNSDDMLQQSTINTVKHPSQMSREEFLQQFKRAPRRGEIGYDAESVAAAEAVGYVMSGSRNKEKQYYVDNIQRKLHEKEARKLRLHFRKVEDERNDNATVETLLALMQQKNTSEK